MKNREIYLIPKSTATLTQSGLLAMLLQRQRQKGGGSPTTFDRALCSIFGATAVEMVAFTARRLVRSKSVTPSAN